MNNFKFILRKPFKELNALCSVFNTVLLDEKISCKFLLQDVIEKHQNFSYLSLIFEKGESKLFVVNRDLDRKISGDDLLKVNELNSYLSSSEYFAYFSSKDSGKILEISVSKDSSDIPKLNTPVIMDSVSVPNTSLILEMDFVVKQPFISLQKLVEIGNSILSDGNAFIAVLPDENGKSRENAKSYSFRLDIYLCHPKRPSLQLFLPLSDFSFQESYVNISKFNFASAYHSPTQVTFSSSRIMFDLYKSNWVSESKIIQRQFDILDTIAP